MSDPKYDLAIITPAAGLNPDSKRFRALERLKNKAALIFVARQEDSPSEETIVPETCTRLGTYVSVSGSSTAALFNKAVAQIPQERLIFLPEYAWIIEETVVHIREALENGAWGGWCCPVFEEAKWWFRPIEGWLLSQAWLDGSAVWDCGFFIQKKAFYVFGRFDEEAIYPAARLVQRLPREWCAILSEKVFIDPSAWMRQGPRRFVQSAAVVGRETIRLCRLGWHHFWSFWIR